MTVFSKTYDTATPAGDDDPAEADDRMRETKAAVQERENVDHYWPLTGTEVSDADAGEHRKVTLRVGSAPTAVADKGFVYAKDVGGKAELFYRDEDGNEIQLTSKGQNLANDTHLTGTDAAGTGSVNLIKAGTNDLATLPDSAEMASSAAPVEDEAIANKKYVDDSVPTSGFVTASGATVFNASIGANDTWENLDLSGTVGSNVALCYFNVSWPGGGGNNWFKIRDAAFGSATEALHNRSGASSFNGTGTGQGFVVCSTNSSGILQIAITDAGNAGTVTIKLIAYVK